MNSLSPAACGQESSFQLSYHPLTEGGNSYSFPCNAAGQVHLDELDERTRNDYLYARGVVGRELSPPRLCACAGSSVQLAIAS